MAENTQSVKSFRMSGAEKKERRGDMERNIAENKPKKAIQATISIDSYSGGRLQLL